MASIKISSKLDRDIKELLKTFPQFRVELNNNGWFCLMGKLQTNGKKVFEVKVMIPKDYPASTPAAFVPDKKKKRLRDAPHYYHLQKKLCLYKDHEWLSSPQTLEWFFGRICKWLNKWEIWKLTGGTGVTDPKTGRNKVGVWPGKDAHFPDKFKRR